MKPVLLNPTPALGELPKPGEPLILLTQEELVEVAQRRAWTMEQVDMCNRLRSAIQRRQPKPFCN